LQIASWEPHPYSYWNLIVAVFHLKECAVTSAKLTAHSMRLLTAVTPFSFFGLQRLISL
jgi:hypothetical protein